MAGTKQALALATLLGAGLVSAAAAQDKGARYGYIGAALHGEQEVDTEGAGETAGADFSAEFDYRDGRMCYLLLLDGLDEFTAAHIHKGAVGKNGPPVIELKQSEDGADVCQDADVALMKDIEANRADYYVNVQTKDYPAGAVRGQLGAE